MNIELVLAPNPGPLTGPGTNTWVVSSSGECIVIDPGPMIDAHVEAVSRTVRGHEPVAVLVTHSHPDHAPASNSLAHALGVPAVGHSPGPDFRPDRTIADGETVGFGDVSAQCLATPGHTADSISFRVGDVLFTGDHIMGGSTVVVEDMSAYLRSLRRLRGIGIESIHPGHGPVIGDPDDVITAYIDHRLEREAQILESVRGGSSTVGEIVSDVYSDVDSALHPVAAISVRAHLERLRDSGEVAWGTDLGWNSPVRPT